MFDRFAQNVKSNPGLAAGGGLIAGSGLASMFSDYNNPADSASPYLKQAQDQLPQYYNPYIQAGQRAQPQLEGAYGRMLDPNKFIQDIGSGYKQSPGYQFQLSQGLAGANNAAAAGGMLGTPQHEFQSAGIAENLANQDFYNYLSHALSTYGQGVQGEQGLYDTGAGASMNLGEDISGNMAQQAGLAYKGQQAENEHDQGGMGSFIGGVSSLLPFFLG